MQPQTYARYRRGLIKRTVWRLPYLKLLLNITMFRRQRLPKSFACRQRLNWLIYDSSTGAALLAALCLHTDLMCVDGRVRYLSSRCRHQESECWKDLCG